MAFHPPWRPLPFRIPCALFLKYYCYLPTFQYVIIDFPGGFPSYEIYCTYDCLKARFFLSYKCSRLFYNMSSQILLLLKVKSWEFCKIMNIIIASNITTSCMHIGISVQSMNYNDEHMHAGNRFPLV